jgi:hypothetical protein
MKKYNHKEDRRGICEADSKEFSASSANRHAFQAVKLGRRIFKKLQDVEDLIEIIAREIKRQADRDN